MEKTILDKSQKLCDAITAAKGIDNSREIAKLDKLILADCHQRQDEIYLGHNREVTELSGRIDINRSKKNQLLSEPSRRTGEAVVEFERFMRPYRHEIAEKIRSKYGELERFKFYAQVGGARYNPMGQAVFSVRTNILAILQAQLNLSKENDTLGDAISPLAELQKRLAEVLSLVPKTFDEATYNLTDAECIMLRQFFPDKNQIEAIDWETEMLSAHSIQFNIGGLLDLTRPDKTLYAA